MKKSTIVLIIGFVVVMAAAVSLYAVLPGEVEPLREKPVFDEPETEQAEEESAAEPEQWVLQAPGFSAIDEAGEAVSLEELVGTPIVLNFWASWCGPCQLEMPDFQKAWEEYGDEGEIIFRMVNVTDGVGETVESAKAFLEENGYTFPVWFDVDQEASYAYAVRTIPRTVFIDADGNVAGLWEGYLTEQGLQAGIDKISGQ